MLSTSIIFIYISIINQRYKYLYQLLCYIEKGPVIQYVKESIIFKKTVNTAKELDEDI